MMRAAAALALSAGLLLSSFAGVPASANSASEARPAGVSQATVSSQMFHVKHREANGLSDAGWLAGTGSIHATAPLRDTDPLPSTDPQIRIVGLAKPILGPDDDLNFEIEITNSTAAPITLDRLVFSSQYAPAISDAQVSRWMFGKSLKQYVTEFESNTVIQPGSSHRQPVKIGRDVLNWSAREFSWGPRGIEIEAEFKNDDGTVARIADRSVVVAFTDAKIQPMPTAIAVPVTDCTLTDSSTLNEDVWAGRVHGIPADEAEGGDEDAAPAESDENKEGDGSKAAVAGSKSGQSAEAPGRKDTASTDPSDTDARESEDSRSDGPSAQANNDGESTGEGEAAPGSPIPEERTNPGAKLAADLAQKWDFQGVTLLADPALRLALPKSAQLLSLSPHDPDFVALRAAGATQLAKNMTDGEVFYPAAAVTGEDVEFAQNEGLLPILFDDWAPSDEPNYTPHARTTLGEGEAIVADSALSRAVSGVIVDADSLDASATPGDQSEASLALDAMDSRQVALALSAIHFRQRPNDPRAQVVGLDRCASKEAQATAKTLLSAPWVKPTNLRQLGPAVETNRTLPDTPDLTGAITPQNLADIDAGLAEFESLANVFSDAGHLNRLAQNKKADLVSVGWRQNPAARATQIAALFPGSKYLNLIGVNTSSTVNMIAQSSALPIPIHNGFSEPVQVRVSVESPDIRLHIEHDVTATLPAGATTTVSVPVEARGSGNLRLDVKVTNEDGVAVGSPDQLRLRLRANWENTGTAIITALIAAVFLFGLYRAVRRGRRSDPIAAEDFVAARPDNLPPSTEGNIGPKEGGVQS